MFEGNVTHDCEVVSVDYVTVEEGSVELWKCVSAKISALIYQR